MHLAQIDIGRIEAPLDTPAMHGFMSRLAEFPFAFTFKHSFPPLS